MLLVIINRSFIIMEIIDQNFNNLKMQNVLILYCYNKLSPIYQLEEHKVITLIVGWCMNSCTVKEN